MMMALVRLAAGKAGFLLFLYLEVLDASFSFDGVIGAFAITENIVVIAAGLGVGAMYIRSMTVYLVRRGTLNEYVHLEHAAMGAICATALILLLSIKHGIPEVVTGLVGLGVIAATFYHLGASQSSSGRRWPRSEAIGSGADWLRSSAWAVRSGAGI